MPRQLKKGLCIVCDGQYVLRNRKYKRTCSPRCSFANKLKSLINIPFWGTLTRKEIIDILDEYYIYLRL